MEEKWDKGRILKERGELIGPSCKLFFEPEPLLIVSAKDQYLYDENGSRYLDCISNVQHVGHCNKKVAAAVAKQMGKTNCNIRFAHSSVVECARELLRRSPPQLTCCFFCNSGSEANDVAMRLCRDATAGAADFVVLDHAYHGHLSSTMALSPYKFKQMPTDSWNSKTDFVHVVPVPDVYRGIHQLNDQHLKNREKLREAALLYAQDVAFVIEAKIKGKDRKLAGFFLESLQSCGGQIITPPGYLEETARYVRAAGGLVVVDEVQTGFGRAGDAFWSFQTHCDADFCPDILTCGKPMGNGFPVSAVLTSREVAKKLGQGAVEYFNTFGGNPVACAAALAVLCVMDEEKLQQHAKILGRYFLEKLEEFQRKHPRVVGDVRGQGLFLGVEFVQPEGERRLPNKGLAENLVSHCRRRANVLLTTDGPDSNVVKIKPPMCFTRENVDVVVQAMDSYLDSIYL